MKDRKTLSGKLFVSTCSEQKAVKLKKCLESRGAEVIMMPLIRIEKVETSPEIMYLRNHISSFDWIFFTSSYSIQAFFELISQAQNSVNRHKQLKYAVIGKTTGEILSKYGVQADYVNPGMGSKDMAEWFLREIREKGKKILFPAGNLYDPTTTDILRRKHEVFQVEVYRTKITDRPAKVAMDMIASDKYTMILFLSPSAFHGFLKLCHPVLKQKRYRLGCIGETTASVIRAAGFVPDLVAGGKGIENLTNHIERQYNGILT